MMVQRIRVGAGKAGGWGRERMRWSNLLKEMKSD
jgi:hypothetical protein